MRKGQQAERFRLGTLDEFTARVRARKATERAARRAPGTRRCAHEGCRAPGEFRAPRSRDKLADYLWFCRAHVEAYNRAWNYHAGLSAAEIERQIERSIIGDRPLWPLGERGRHTAARFARRFHRAEFDPFDFFAGERAEVEGERRRRADGPGRGPAPEEDQALAALGLTPPADLATIKARYKRLAKRYHPDANGGDRAAEEQLKRINEAYSTLKKRLAS
jgi:hypothetical protein